MSRTTRFAAGLAATALIAGAAVPATASAQKPLDAVYQLTPKEKKLVCTGGVSVIVYSDGFTVDCQSGWVSYS